MHSVHLMYADANSFYPAQQPRIISNTLSHSTDFMLFICLLYVCLLSHCQQGHSSYWRHRLYAKEVSHLGLHFEENGGHRVSDGTLERAMMVSYRLCIMAIALS